MATAGSNVRLSLPRPFQRYADNQESILVRGETVASAIHDACLRYPALRERLLNDDQTLMAHVAAVMNDEVLPHDGLGDRMIPDGAVLQIHFVASGGA